MNGCDVGIIIATATERLGFDDHLADRTTIRGEFTFARGVLGQRSVVIATSGIGRKRARKACEALVAGHRPQRVLSVGFAGGLCPSLERGDFVNVERIVSQSDDEIELNSETPDVAPRSGRLHTGLILTADKIIAAPEEKQSLGAQHDALAVDMETWAIADYCQAADIPCHGLRIISDAVDEALPPEIEAVARQSTLPGRLGAAAGVLLRRPSKLKDFLQLRFDGRALSAELADFVARWLAAAADDET